MTGVQTCALPICFPVTIPSEEIFTQLLAYLTQGHTLNLFPSVQFGLESLFFKPQFPLETSTYAFLNGSAEDIAHRAQIAACKGYSTVKVKLGSFEIEEAQHVIRLLKDRFRLRVDCNCAFSFQQAIRLFSPFDPSSFDYIEDPTHELDALPHFTHPFALDETLMHSDQLPLNLYSNLCGFIVKPSLIGGRKGCLPLLDYAKKHHLKVVLSPAFETGLGLLQILKLGQELNLLQECIGLDTHRFLKQDLLQDTLEFDHPSISIKQEPTVNSTHLQKIAHGTSYLPPL